MRISEFIARTITQRSRLVWASLALLTGACLAILITSLRLDSEIFNVLPGRFSSVQGLKIYDREFEQTHELTFALLCTPQDVDKLENFAPVFAEKLRKQPWCTRVLAGSPMATPDGIRDLQSIAVPLLLNLEPSDPATAQNSGSAPSLASTDRRSFAAIRIRAFHRPARSHCASAQTFCRKHRD